MSIFEDIKNSMLADGLDDDDLKKLAQIAEELEFHKDAVIFHEKNEEDSIYILFEGKVAIERRSLPGRHIGPTLIQNVRRGQLIGEMGFIERRTRSATGVARSHVRLARFHFKDLEALIERDAAFGVKFLRLIAELLSRRLRRMNEQWVRAVADNSDLHELEYF